MGIMLERDDTPIWEELAKEHPEVVAILNHEDQGEKADEHK